MTDSFKKDDGTGMTPPPNSGAAAGAVTSREATRKNPRQGLKIDRNKHGIRRETSTVPRPPKKTGRKKV
jgi:hypothetical protein